MKANDKTEHQSAGRVSNITGGITDEEFADEFLAHPTAPGTNRSSFQFNFLGAELEKVSSAKNIRDELKR